MTAGGKGINVARVYQRLGGVAPATGFLGGANGEYLERACCAEGIQPDFVAVRGGVSASASPSWIPWPDPRRSSTRTARQVTRHDCEALLTRLRELLPGHDAVVLSGSMPPGTPPASYRDIVVWRRTNTVFRQFWTRAGQPLARGGTRRSLPAEAERS